MGGLEPFPGLWLFEDRLTAMEQILELRETVLHMAKAECKKKHYERVHKKGWVKKHMKEEMEKGCTVSFTCKQRKKIRNGFVTRGIVVYPVAKKHLIECFEELRKPDTGFTKRQKSFFQKMLTQIEKISKKDVGEDSLRTTVENQLSNHNSNLKKELVLVETERCLHRKQVAGSSPTAAPSTTASAFEWELEKSAEVKTIPRKRSSEMRKSFDAPSESQALQQFRRQRCNSFEEDYLMS